MCKDWSPTPFNQSQIHQCDHEGTVFSLAVQGCRINAVFKGLVHPKMKMVINYSPSCRSNPLRSSFIFGTQIKMFLMKSESSLTLHRQQRNWNVPRSRNVVNTSVKQSMWHQWLNFSFATLREFFFLRKENNNNLLNSSPPSYVFCHFGEYLRTYLT